MRQSDPHGGVVCLVVCPVVGAALGSAVAHQDDLVAAVLASLPLQWAQSTHQSPDIVEACQTIQDVAYAVVLFSIITCSVLVIITEKKQGDATEHPENKATVPAAEAPEVQQQYADTADDWDYDDDNEDE